MKSLRFLKNSYYKISYPLITTMLHSNKNESISFVRGFCSVLPKNSNSLNFKFDEPLKKYIEFTCKQCNTRVKKTFSKVAYDKGVVIIRCDGCESLHLISDNLGWITDDKKWKIEKLTSSESEDE